MAELNRELPSYWMHLDYHEQELRERHPHAVIARGPDEATAGRWVYLSTGTGWVRIGTGGQDHYGQVVVSEEGQLYNRRVYLQQLRQAAASHLELAVMRGER